MIEALYTLVRRTNVAGVAVGGRSARKAHAVDWIIAWRAILAIEGIFIRIIGFGRRAVAGIIAAYYSYLSVRDV